MKKEMQGGHEGGQFPTFLLRLVMKCRWRLGHCGLIEQQRLQQLLCEDKTAFISDAAPEFPLREAEDKHQRGAEQLLGRLLPLLN